MPRENAKSRLETKVKQQLRSKLTKDDIRYFARIYRVLRPYGVVPVYQMPASWLKCREHEVPDYETQTPDISQ